VAPVAGGLSPAAQSQLLGGLTAFSVGLQGGSSPDDNPPSPHPHDKGAAREQRVAELVGGKVVRKRVKVKGLGSTDIDVLGPNGEFIEVGGPAKAKLNTFGKQLQRLKRVAEENGVPALVYLEEGTPQAAIDLAIRWLGESNVKIFRP
jgi:filamentous hemagglutinin